MKSSFLYLAVGVILLIPGGCVINPDPQDPIREIACSSFPDIGTIKTTYRLSAVLLAGGDTVAGNEYQVKWDWENDGTYDTPWISLSTAEHSFTTPGKKTVAVKVRSADFFDGRVMNVLVQDLIQITNNTTTSPQRHVDWSRDGSNRILFDWGWGNDDSGGSVWMMRYPGGEPECLITNEGVGSQWDGVYPKLSPDGTKIVFGPDPKGYLVIFDITSKTTLSLGKKWGSQAAWSPSGRYILSSWALYEPDVDLVSYVPFGGSFAWAPTEDIICINRSGIDPVSGRYLQKVGFVRFPGYSTLEERNIPAEGRVDWSSDGRFVSLGFTSGTLHILEHETGKVYSVRVDGLHDCWGPAWSEDGTMLAFEAREESADREKEIWAIRFPQEL